MTHHLKVNMYLIHHRNCVSLFKPAFLDAAPLSKNAILRKHNPIQSAMRAYLCRIINPNVETSGDRMTTCVDPQNHYGDRP